MAPSLLLRRAGITPAAPRAWIAPKNCTVWAQSLTWDSCQNTLPGSWKTTSRLFINLLYPEMLIQAMKTSGRMVWFSALRVRSVTPTQHSTPEGWFSCPRPWRVPINTPGLPGAAPLQLPELNMELPLSPSPNMQTTTAAPCSAPQGSLAQEETELCRAGAKNPPQNPRVRQRLLLTPHPNSHPHFQAPGYDCSCILPAEAAEDWALLQPPELNPCSRTGLCFPFLHPTAHRILLSGCCTAPKSTAISQNPSNYTFFHKIFFSPLVSLHP